MWRCCNQTVGHRNLCHKDAERPHNHHDDRRRTVALPKEEKSVGPVSLAVSDQRKTPELTENPEISVVVALDRSSPMITGIVLLRGCERTSRNRSDR